MRTHRMLRTLTLAPLLTAVVGMLALVALARPASAASLNDCMNAPGNGTCNGYQLTKNDYCWRDSYNVTSVSYDDGDWHFIVYLRYSKACKSNFAYVDQIGRPIVGVYNFAAKVRRGAGADGPYVMQHGPFSQTLSDAISPLVYSPNNPAQACISTNSNDQAKCTSYV